MKQLSKLWLDLFFCFLLIFITGHTSNSFHRSYIFSQEDLLPNHLELGENNYK